MIKPRAFTVLLALSDQPEDKQPTAPLEIKLNDHVHDDDIPDDPEEYRAFLQGLFDDQRRVFNGDTDNLPSNVQVLVALRATPLTDDEIRDALDRLPEHRIGDVQVL